MLREACCYERLSEGRVRCNLCIRRCTIGEGERGFCRVRGNRGGRLYNLYYGELSSFSVDYVEKTPLYLFYPNHQFLNLGGVGCNLACEFCLAWNITQVEPEEVRTSRLTPEQIVSAAIATRCRGIVYTHSEPTLNLEFYLEVMKAARERGLKNVLATNGYVTLEAFSMLEPYLDAVALTVKGSAEFYSRRCGFTYAREHLHALAERIRRAGIHLEVVMVLVPNENDDEASVAEAVELAKRGDAGITITLDFGAKLLIPSKSMPRVLSVALSSKEELSSLEVPEVGEEKMAPLKLLLESEGFAAGNLRMPFTFAATLLYPLESFLLDLNLDKRFVHELLDYALRYNLELARAMLEAGAELIFTEDPSASSSVISPSHYREFAYPYEKRLIREIKSRGAKVVLHICGDVSALLEDMLTLGVDAISVDESMDMAALRKKTVAWGNVSPSLLVNGSPEEVAEASREIAELRSGVVLSSGCVVPGNAKPENLLAMVAAAKG